MHEWHTNDSTNILSLINEFIGYEFNTDCSGREKVTDVRITGRTFSSDDEARSYITRSSYGGNSAYLAAYTTKKLTKAYSDAFADFITRYREYTTFKNNLTIAYGRKSSKATCPYCGSSINLKYGNRFKSCPVCGSKKIISDSNWKTLETKYKMVEKASEKLNKQAQKNNVMFICGIEWHY